MAVLIIGLGGTGGEVIKRAKDKVKSIAKPDEIAFYYIDAKKSAGSGLDPGEFKHIGGFRVDEKVNDHWGIIQEWWYPDDYRPSFETIDGAGQDRLIGRLCWYLNLDEIKNDLQKIITNLSGNYIDIIVVSSSGGGMGSSIVVDMGFLLKNIGSAGGKHCKYWLILLDPSATAHTIALDPPTKKGCWINGLAMLTELEFYMTKPTTNSDQPSYRFKYQDSSGNTQELTNFLTQTDSAKGVPPYDGILLIQHINTASFHMNNKEDYFHLIADGMWPMVTASFNPKQADQTGLENHFHALWDAPNTSDGHCQKYASFGFASIVFPERLVKNYCLKKYKYILLSRILETKVTAEVKIDEEVGKFLFEKKIQESDNQDQLLNFARKNLEDTGHSAKKILKKRWSSSDDTLKTEFRAALIHAGQDYKKILNQWNKDLVDDLNSWEKHFDDELNKHMNEDLNALKKKMIEDIGKGQWLETREWLNKFIKAIENEMKSVKEVERAWMLKIPPKNLEANLNIKVNNIESAYKPSSIIQKVGFGKKKRQKEANYLKGQLSSWWVDTYFKYKFFERILGKIEYFYSEIKTRVEFLYQIVNHLIMKAENDKKDLQISGLLPMNPDRASHKHGIDYNLNVCCHENVVNDMILKEIVEQNLSNNLVSISEHVRGLINNKLNKEELCKEFEKKLDEVVNNEVNLAMQGLSLAEALKREAQYFWNSRNNALKNAFDSKDYDTIVDNIQNLAPLYGYDYLNKIWDEYKKASNQAKGLDDENVITHLIKGRIKEILKWANPFWYWEKGKKGIRNPNPFYIYCLESNTNQKIHQILEEITRSSNTPTKFDIKDPYQLFFFHLECIQPLWNLPLFSKQTDVLTTERNRHILKKVDSKSIGFADRRFLFDEERKYFSIFPTTQAIIEKTKKEANLVFGLSEMFELLKPSGKTRANYRLEVDVAKPYLKGKILGKSLQDAISVIESNDTLRNALKKLCDEEWQKLKYSSKASQKNKVDNHLSFYEGCGIKSKSNKHIYDALRQAILDYAKQEGILP